ncbi:MAG: guanylate kinase [Ignavibacterium sp.]|nr:guanylate kinase [Ignavibacterium sp.]
MLNSTSINESKIFVISAPSGGGKTSIVKSVLKDFPELKFSVSATTRPRRENEIDGVDYFFITEQEFLKKIQNQEFIEWERFYDYYYGTPKDQVYKAFENNYPILLELDVKGALNVKKIFPQAILIFIDVPSLDELVRRLQARKTENESDLKKRIERAKMELNYKNQFDYIFVNNKLEDVTKEVKNLFREILRKEK